MRRYAILVAGVHIIREDNVDLKKTNDSLLRQSDGNVGWLDDTDDDDDDDVIENTHPELIGVLVWKWSISSNRFTSDKDDLNLFI